MSETTVFSALSAVMEEVQGIGKTERNTQQNYNFRGIDAVVNAVGPALRKHGVIVVPIRASHEVEHYQTSKGTPMRDVTLTVTFRFYGPNGDHFDAQVCGESADSGDKAVPKAHSVAYRTLLLQALCIPTDEPDPDSHTYERASSEPVSGDGGESSGRAGSGESRKTKPELLAYLSDILVALKTQAPQTDWTEKARKFSKEHYETTKSQELTKPQLESLVLEAEKWLVHLEAEDIPFG